MNRFRSTDNGASRFSNLKSGGSNVFLSSKTEEPIVTNKPIHRDEFPSFSKSIVKPKETNITTLSNTTHIQTHIKNIDDEFPTFSKSIVKTKEPTEVKLSYNKAITTAEKIKEERTKEAKEREAKEKKIVVKPGWVCFYKNRKTGKMVRIHGPKTEYEKQHERQEILNNNLNYQMSEAITRLTERWENEKEAFDEYHWPGAFEEKYGYEPTYDEDDEEYNSDDEDDSDYDSE
jgi:hypothetical protein